MGISKNKEIASVSECLIVGAISRGMTIEEIAKDKKLKLGLNKRQVYFKLFYLKTKFDCKSLPHLVATFLREGIIK